MPALPPVPFTVRLDWRYQIGGNTNVRTRFFINYGGSLSLADAGTWMATLSSKWAARWAAHMSFGVTLLDGTMTDLNTPTGVQITQPINVAGLGVDDTTSAAISVVAEWEIRRRYRGGKARSYLPGGQDAQTFDTRSWTPAAVGLWTTDMVGWLADASAPGPGAVGVALPVAVSYYQGFTVQSRLPLRSRNVNTVRAVPLVDAITGVEISNVFGQQRRRLQRA